MTDFAQPGPEGKGSVASPTDIYTPVDPLIARVVVPYRLALILRGKQTVGYNPNLNVWHRVSDEVAETLRWLRSGRDRSVLPSHLARRFDLDNADQRLEAILRWAILRRLLYLDVEPTLPPSRLPSNPLSTVYWICTQACNLRCTYCYQDATVARDNELSTAEGRNLVDQVAEAGARTFVFTGGEPFSRRDLLEIAHYSKSCGLRTNVITNGHYIVPRRVAAIAEVFDKVTVSLDHGIPEHHDSARGQGSWRRAAAAIDLLLEAGVVVDINSVLTRPGLSDVGELLAFVRRRPVGQHRIVPQYPMGRGESVRSDELKPEELLEFEDGLSCVNESRDASSKDGSRSPEQVLTSPKGVRRSHCGAGLSEVAVDPEGWVYPCKLLQYEQYRAANVRERRLVEIFASDPIIRQFQRPFVDMLKPCTTCIIRNHCGGGCRGIHASFSNDWTIAEPLFCAQLRRSFELDAFASTGDVPPRRPARFVQPEPQAAGTSNSHRGATFIPLSQVVRRC